MQQKDSRSPIRGKDPERPEGMRFLVVTLPESGPSSDPGRDGIMSDTLGSRVVEGEAGRHTGDLMTVVEANRLVSFGLVVLIWLVQVVIYPAFDAIDPARFVRWHAGYTRAVTWIVAPLMFAQVALLGRILLVSPGVPAWVAASMVAVAWLATFALAVPDHDRLQARGLDGVVVRRLVAMNWIRTVAWSLAFLASLAG